MKAVADASRSWTGNQPAARSEVPVSGIWHARTSLLSSARAPVINESSRPWHQRKNTVVSLQFCRRYFAERCSWQKHRMPTRRLS